MKWKETGGTSLVAIIHPFKQPRFLYIYLFVPFFTTLMALNDFRILLDSLRF
jgi:hypothetical protein